MKKPRQSRPARHHRAAAVRAGAQTQVGESATRQHNRAGPRFFRRAGRPFALGVFLLICGLCAFGLVVGVPHDFTFAELGSLLVLSQYDLVLALAAVSLLIAMEGQWRARLVILFALMAVLLSMLAFFDAIFSRIMAGPLGEVLYLVAPFAVSLCGISLWLPQRGRRMAAVVSAACLGFSLSLFIGLDDIGVGMASFWWSAVGTALWLLAVPGLILCAIGQAQRIIAARILGAWLIAIALINTGSLYAPESGGTMKTGDTGTAPPISALPSAGLFTSPSAGLSSGPLFRASLAGLEFCASGALHICHDPLS